MVFQGGRLYLAGYQILAMGFLQGTLARYYKNNSVAGERRSYLKIRTLHPEMRRVCDNNAFVFLHFKKMPFRRSNKDTEY